VSGYLVSIRPCRYMKTYSENRFYDVELCNNNRIVKSLALDRL